jgi:geranyl-CoA carboxylase alpha subunit
MHTVGANIRAVHWFRVRGLAPAPRNDDARTMAFSKLLIGNRGEIACRIARTARDLGLRTVAVFSDADADALHVHAADEAVRIGPAPARESYLNIQAILAAAKRSGADAVHPGYGFLAENAEFAKACEDAGLVFIGPTPAAIQAMGNKAQAKRLMTAAGIPCVPGHEGDQSDAALAIEAHRIGFPLMIKAAAGGGGRGMRLVGEPGALTAALAGARSEARNAFGSDELILEQAIADARHIEIQIFADAQGNVIHLGERDCSIQRRHQKVIEEAPSPAVSPELRGKMGEAAVAAARAIRYRGAGTVEFLLDASENFYFLEMNTRLQVEHPVTEAISGLDLVAWQLRVAAGEPLPRQHEVRLEGHAIEARLYAEDSYENFLPRSGTILAWRPATGAGVRVDHGLRPGQAVSPFYDPLLAKLIGWGTTREEARRRLLAALEDTVVLGIDSNRSFLGSVLAHPVFVAGEATTAFIDRHCSAQLAKRPVPGDDVVALAAALLFAKTATQQDSMLANWSSTGALAWPLRVSSGGAQFAVEIIPTGRGRFSVALGEKRVAIGLLDPGSGELRFAVDGLQRAHFAFADDVLHLDVAGWTAAFRETTLEAASTGDRRTGSQLLAPMNGAVVAVLAEVGDSVKKGQRILIVEAMKMQHEIAAERDGILARIHVKAGDQVATRQLLGELQELQSGNQDPELQASSGRTS